MRILASVPQVVTVERMRQWLQSIGVSAFYAVELPPLYESIGSGYGVRWDWALFQAVHETNKFRFGGDVSAHQNNFAGIGAVGNSAPGETFSTVSMGVIAHIQHLAIYAGAVVLPETIVAARTRQVAGWILGKAQTFEDLTGRWATDDAYFQKIHRYALAFEQWLSERLARDADGAGFWVDEFADAGVVCVMRGSALVESFQVGNSVKLKALAYARASEIGAGTFKLAPAGKPLPSVIVPVPKPEQPAPALSVLLDPGHSERHPGARGKNPSVQEEDLNRFQAECLKQALAAVNIEAQIIDPIDDDLLAIGRAAKGFDAFVSLHLNAFSGREHYTCAMVHPTFSGPQSASSRCAAAWAAAVANAIGNPLFGGSRGYPKGVYATGLSVLRGAAEAKCPIAFLSEAEFIDDEYSNEPIMKRIEIAMTAGAKALASQMRGGMA